MFVVVFATSLVLTQFLAWQQYKISKETRRAELVHEATDAKDRLRNVLFNDIAAANTLAIIYKQYGVPARFDSVAHQIIQNSRYAEALQITENGIVRNVYPGANYKTTIGTNVNADPVRRAEETRAIERKDIYFAGPRRLRFGDAGILGKVPVISDRQVVAVVTVLTRLPALKKALEPENAGKDQFAYQLVKAQGKNAVPFSLSDAKPGKNESVSVKIPEGDWLLRVAYNQNYGMDNLPYQLSALGFLFSLAGGLLAYRKAQEPYKLNKIIAEKTDQLAKSEKYFRTLIETSSDAIVLLDKSGQVLYQSPSTEKILGYTLAEMQQMDGRQLVHPDDTGVYDSDFRKEISEPGAMVQRIHRVKQKNGSYIYTEGTYRNLLHDDTIKAIVHSYKDITEKVLSEQVLIESENRFRRAFEDSAIGMGLTSIEEHSMGRWLKVNRSLHEMLGYTEEELLSLTFMQITHPDDLAGDLAAQERILRGESDTYRLEKRYIHKNGSYVWINLNVSMVRDKDKKPVYLVAQVENITERIESQNKFQNLVENFIVGVYIHQNNKIVYVNPRLIEETGYMKEEVIGKAFEEFIYKDDLGLVQRVTDEREKGLIDVVRYEARFVAKDGEPIWFEIFGSRTVYRGAPALMGTMVNITERKAAEKEVHRLTRLYQFISSINESMLKAEDTDQVFTDACRIAVEVGGFQMAWIGSYEKKNDRIIPLTWSGHEDGFLAKINVAGIKVSESAIPSARAIRKQTPFYYNNIANDPDIPADVKHEMTKRRYFSGVSFPIFIGGEIVAAMVLLMSEPFFFNEEEIELLHDVTDNITYALDKIKIQGLQRQSQANVRSIFDTTNIGYLLLDTNYDIIALNQQMREIYIDVAGFELKEGDNLIELLVPEKKEHAKSIYDKVVQTNQSIDYESTYGKEDTYRYFIANVKPVHDGKKVIGICISTIDITERKKMTLDLLSHVKAIEEQNKKLREIAWIQSHVVRAPLSRLMGLIDLIGLDEGVDEETRTILDYIITSANELDEIIKSISDKVYVDE